MTEYVVDRENVWPYGSQHEEIVRCRDCENSSHFFQWLTPSKKANVETWVCRNMDGFEIEPDGFCAWGEKVES